MPVQVLEGGEDLLDRGALMSSVAGILEAQLTQHIALFEKMCGPVKHVRLAVRRRKNGGQGRGRKRKSDERVVVDVASWEEEEVQSFRVVPAGAESSELLARRIKLVKFDERLGAGAEGGEWGGGCGGGGAGGGGGEEEEGGFGWSAVPNDRVLEECRTQPGDEEDRVLQRARRGSALPNARVLEECRTQPGDEEGRVLRRSRRGSALPNARVLEECRHEPGDEEDRVLQSSRRGSAVSNARVLDECRTQPGDEEDRVLRRAR